MNLALLRLLGKRFFGLIICVPALILGFIYGDPTIFPSYATSLGLMYGAYVAGQSATDFKKSV